MGRDGMVCGVARCGGWRHPHPRRFSRLRAPTWPSIIAVTDSSRRAPPPAPPGRHPRLRPARLAPCASCIPMNLARCCIRPHHHAASVSYLRRTPARASHQPSRARHALRASHCHRAYGPAAAAAAPRAHAHRRAEPQLSSAAPPATGAARRTSIFLRLSSLDDLILARSDHLVQADPLHARVRDEVDHLLLSTPWHGRRVDGGLVEVALVEASSTLSRAPSTSMPGRGPSSSGRATVRGREPSCCRGRAKRRGMG